MPTTDLKQVEWTRIAQIMSYKLNKDLWSEYLKSTEFSTRERVALDKALSEMYGSDDLRDIVERGDVTAESQLEIDNNIRAFVWRHRQLSFFDKIPIVTVIQRMPFTNLSLDDIARVEQIKTFLIGDLWTRAFDKGEKLTFEQSSAVREVGLQLYGSDSIFTQ